MRERRKGAVITSPPMGVVRTGGKGGGCSVILPPAPPGGLSGMTPESCVEFLRHHLRAFSYWFTTCICLNSVFGSFVPLVQPRSLAALRQQ